MQNYIYIYIYIYTYIYIYIYGCSSLANQTYLATHKPKIEPPYTRQVVHPLPQTRQGESVTKLKSLPLKGHGEGRIRGITRQEEFLSGDFSAPTVNVSKRNQTGKMDQSGFLCLSLVAVAPSSPNAVTGYWDSFVFSSTCPSAPSAARLISMHLRSRKHRC